MITQFPIHTTRNAPLDPHKPWPPSPYRDPRLTARAVGSSPARLTVAGVWGNTAAMHTLLCTQGCRG